LVLFPKGYDTAEEVSTGGAVKLAGLAGEVFNNKNKKKGQQNTYRYFMEDKTGHIVNFPDTSNTRYQSYGQAASALIINWDLYLELLEQIRDKKELHTWTNIEKNVYIGLKDPVTFEELIVLALFNQCISHPYMRLIRGLKDQNILNFGPFHQKVLQFMESIISMPKKVYAPEATYETASLDGQLWEWPEVFYKIQALAPNLSHLDGLLVAFFTSAVETWKRFTEEFKPGGIISSLTPEAKDDAFMEPTNDINEGALGSMRKAFHHYPNMTLDTFNAWTMVKRNKTVPYMVSKFTSSDRKKICGLGRKQDSSKRESKRHCELAKSEQFEVDKNRKQDQDKEVKLQEHSERLASLEVFTSFQKLKEAKLRNELLDLQLDWHCQYNSDVPKKSHIPTKSLKLAALEKAIYYYHNNFINRSPKSRTARKGQEVDKSEAVEEEYSDEDPDA